MGELKSHMILRTRVPPLVSKQQVVRTPTRRSRVCQEDKQQQVTPGTRTTRESGVSCRTRVLPKGTLGATRWAGELRPETDPETAASGEHPPRRQDTEKSPRRTGQDPGPKAGQTRVWLPTQVWGCQWVKETKFTEYRVAGAASL